eukprot:5414170-Pleurochrysis_carterae.AAC.1
MEAMPVHCTMGYVISGTLGRVTQHIKRSLHFLERRRRRGEVALVWVDSTAETVVRALQLRVCRCRAHAQHGIVVARSRADPSDVAQRLIICNAALAAAVCTAVAVTTAAMTADATAAIAVASLLSVIRGTRTRRAGRAARGRVPLALGAARWTSGCAC